MRKLFIGAALASVSFLGYYNVTNYQYAENTEYVGTVVSKPQPVWARSDKPHYGKHYHVSVDFNGIGVQSVNVPYKQYTQLKTGDVYRVKPKYWPVVGIFNFEGTPQAADNPALHKTNVLLMLTSLLVLIMGGFFVGILGLFKYLED
ncbi:MAG: hypothetical protein GY833_12780 [Aestuariibacter sp.]|nr:hypothetical protein [Aestuariibacter sp.]|tara:strand:- start:134150 stop:134590 length:441 start_codon:yes stop_codon:yes gene_type:complete